MFGTYIHLKCLARVRVLLLSRYLVSHVATNFKLLNDDFCLSFQVCHGHSWRLARLAWLSRCGRLTTDQLANSWHPFIENIRLPAMRRYRYRRPWRFFKQKTTHEVLSIGLRSPLSALLVLNSFRTELQILTLQTGCFNSFYKYSVFSHSVRQVD